MDDTEIKYFIESALLAAGQPLNVDQLQNLFDDGAEPEKSQIRQAISSLLEDYEDRGFTIREVASGFRIQIESDMVERLQKLWEQRPPRYSRAMFETLALIAYRQPMTRGEIRHGSRVRWCQPRRVKTVKMGSRKYWPNPIPSRKFRSHTSAPLRIASGPRIRMPSS